MGTTQKFTLFLVRLSLGWVFFYAGITKIMNPDWTAAGFLKSAQTFPEFYARLAEPSTIGLVNLANEWGLTLLGASLILGIGVRLSGFLGAVLMLMYYFPGLDFPKLGANAYLVDEHIVYAATLLFLAGSGAGRYYGLANWFGNSSLARVPGLRALLS